MIEAELATKTDTDLIEHYETQEELMKLNKDEPAKVARGTAADLRAAIDGTLEAFFNQPHKVDATQCD